MIADFADEPRCSCYSRASGKCGVLYGLTGTLRRIKSCLGRLGLTLSEEKPEAALKTNRKKNTVMVDDHTIVSKSTIK